MDKIQMHEMISALADGQLRGEALERVIQTIATDPQARTAWHTYHLVGDVLRTGELPTGTAPARFLAGFQVRLERERAGDRVLVEPAGAGAAVLPVATEEAFPATEAANDGSFRWKVVAGCASLAAVAAIGWSSVVSISAPPQQPQLAQGGAPALTARAEQPPIMIRDPRLDEMLAAHRQFGGGASALQTTASFLRNAAFEGPDR
jgi:sigma-E factor negative regulatory protein RseA